MSVPFINSDEGALAFMSDSLRRGVLCPILGAGASADLGVSSWLALTRSLAQSVGCFPFQPSPGHQCRLALAAPSEAAAIAEERLLDAVIPRGEDLPRLLELLGASTKPYVSLRERLYASVPSDWTQHEDTFRATALYWLAALAIITSYTSRTRQFHVITYNVDVLLEEAIAALGHRAEALTGEEAASRWEPVAPMRLVGAAYGSGPVTVRVAHPHGILPRPTDGQRTPVGVIMGANEYDSLISVPFNNPNLWQLSAFSHFSCLFYGWSFQDYAVRRMMRFGSTLSTYRDARLQEWHVALIKRATAVDGCSPSTATQPSLDIIDRLSEEWLARLRVHRAGRSSHAIHRSFVQAMLSDASSSGLFRFVH